jgi:peptidoglycan/xylan/chitin deacetylase (PgdA/CDA1 family)
MSTLLAKLARKTLALPSRCPGYRPAARRLRAGSVAIVMYHGVTAEPLPAFNWCQLDVEQFTRQIEFLSQHYTLLSVREVVDRLARRAPLPPRAAALTFDDGFRNVFTTAYPILQRYQAPATVFLVTSFIGTRQPAWPERLFHALTTSPCERTQFGGSEWPLTTADERVRAYGGWTARLKRMPQPEHEDQLTQLIHDLGGAGEVPGDCPLAILDWSEIEQMARGGLVDFGSHTHTHPILSRCPLETQYEELRQSRELLRQRLGEADLFAYPNGTRADFTPETQKLLMELDYRCGLATTPGLNRSGADPYALKRVNVGADETMNEFELHMIGL